MRGIALWAMTGLLLASADAASQERRVAEVNGMSLSYVDIGEGEPLLLLHGFGETGSTWDPILDALRAEHRLIVPDLPGHGYSGDLTSDFSFAEAARDISALLDHLEVRNSRAMGFSAGGLILLHMATNEPDRLDAMVIIGAGPYLTESARSVMRAMDIESIPMDALQSTELAQPDTVRTRRLMRQFVALAEDYSDPNFTAPLLGTIRAPTLIVTGDQDPFFPPSVVGEMHAAIPGSHLFVIPGHEHYPFPGEVWGREYFVSVVLDFFRDTRAAR
ncbi:MAG: alpha/beta fold hydrolase [Longimicrobiales bacterium]